MRKTFICVLAMLLLLATTSGTASTLIVNPGFSGGTFRFWVQTAKEPNIGYVVEYKDALEQTNWTFMRSFTGDGELVPVVDAAPASRQRYYRVGIVVI